MGFFDWLRSRRSPPPDVQERKPKAKESPKDVQFVHVRVWEAYKSKNDQSHQAVNQGRFSDVISMWTDVAQDPGFCPQDPINQLKPDFVLALQIIHAELFVSHAQLGEVERAYHHLREAVMANRSGASSILTPRQIENGLANLAALVNLATSGWLMMNRSQLLEIGLEDIDLVERRAESITRKHL